MLNWSKLLDIELRNTGNADVDDALAGVYLEPR